MTGTTHDLRSQQAGQLILITISDCTCFAYTPKLYKLLIINELIGFCHVFGTNPPYGRFPNRSYV
jgi:hypothetical protein